MSRVLFSGAKLMGARAKLRPLTMAPPPPPRHLKRPCSTLSPFPELDSHMLDLRASLLDKIASILVAPNNPEINGSLSLCAGVFVDPALVVTSASVVARVSADPGAGSPIYRSQVASTAALVSGSDSPIELQPVAVSFASDVAVLRVVDPDGPQLPYCPTAASPPEKESLLMSISYDLERQDGWGVSLANVRSVEQKTIKSKAPWPLDDGLPWLEHDWLIFHRGPPPPSSALFNCKEKVTGSITKLSGSPWFNLYGELVGIASWVLRDDPGSFSVGYAAPPSSILAVLHYAKTKGAEDRVVMDKWVQTEVIAGDSEEKKTYIPAPPSIARNPNYRNLNPSSTMASSIRQLHRRLFRLSRRYCSGASAVSRPEPEHPIIFVCPSVVALHTHFSGGGAPDSAGLGTGVFVDTRLIVTSASTVGRLSTFYDSGSRSVLHNGLISRTMALTGEGKALRTTPVAVNFSGDLAVLEVAEAEGPVPPPCTVVDVFEEKETVVFTLTMREGYTEILFVPHLPKSVRPKSPWPLEEALGWVDYGVSAKYSGSKNAEIEIANFTGSPWFNDRKELVGYASWAAADADGDVKSYAVPPSRIRSMIDYAKSKGRDDPIVMDRWIKEYAISDDNPAIFKEGVPAWYTNFVMHIMQKSIICQWTGQSFRKIREY